MGFWDSAEALWQQTAQQHVHGWVQSDRPTVAIEPGEGKHYLQVRLAAMSLRFSRQRFAGRSPVLHSSIRWPVAGGWITVSHTLDRARFTAPGDDTTDFAVYQVSDVALSGDLPLNSGDVELNVALLAAPGSSLLDHATAFLDDIASLTLVPQLSAVAPVAAKIADGVDRLLGNEEVSGVLAFATSVPADSPRAGFYLVTDLPAQGADDLRRFAVRDGALLQWDGDGQAWKPAGGFSYLLLELRVEGTKPTRWTELPDITTLSQGALQRLAQANTAAEVQEAAPQLRVAAMRALYSPDLVHADRDPAAAALVDQWHQQVRRLAALMPAGPQAGARTLAPPDASQGQSVVAAAQRLGTELDEALGAVRTAAASQAERDRAGAALGLVPGPYGAAASSGQANTGPTGG